MTETESVFVFDTSAWLSLIEDEPGAETVQAVLEKSASENTTILVSFMTFMEVFYITLQERGVEEALTRIQLMRSLPITRVESTESIGSTAAQLKAKHRISVADAWIAALAKERNAILVHKDPEFEPMKSDIKFLQLPYK